MAIACCLYSCKPVEAPFQETTGVTLTPASVSIFPGDAVTLEAAVAPSNATSTLLTWTSSDSKVASVDNWGRVTGVAPGSCVITAKTASGGYTATCNVTVKPIAETSISINPSELTVYYDETETVTVVFVPDNASYKTVTWKSADNTIATVDENGKVKGVGLGSTTITATSKNGKTATCNVTVAVRMPTEAETLDAGRPTTPASAVSMARNPMKARLPETAAGSSSLTVLHPGPTTIREGYVPLPSLSAPVPLLPSPSLPELTSQAAGLCSHASSIPTLDVKTSRRARPVPTSLP